MELCYFISREWEMIAMKKLRKGPTIFELLLVSCLLLVLTITVTGLQNKEVLFVTDAPISDSMSIIYRDNASISNESINYGSIKTSISNESIINASIINASMSNESIGISSISNASFNGTYKPETELPYVPIEVNDKNIELMINRYSPFVVDFWEIGCRPCKSIDPTINEMAFDFKGQIVFGKLCIDRNAASKKKYKISSTPTLLIFKDGTLVYRHVGNYPKQRLEEIILRALNTN
jgi:thioredoxin 1